MIHCGSGTQLRHDVEIKNRVDMCCCKDFELPSGKVGLCLVGVHRLCCVSCRLDAVYDVVHRYDVGEICEQLCFDQDPLRICVMF